MFFGKKKRLIVRTAGDPVLATSCKPVLEITQEVRDFADYMLQAMHAFDGIGLAAPQAGQAIRLVVIDVPAPEDGTPLSAGEEQLLPKMPLVLVNPQILGSSDTVCERDEGCLSVPDIFAPVVRPERVIVRASDLDGQLIECECGGLLGRCIQHELDHLDGILFTDRLAPDAARRIAAELEHLKRAGVRRNYQRITTK